MFSSETLDMKKLLIGLLAAIAFTSAYSAEGDLRDIKMGLGATQYQIFTPFPAPGTQCIRYMDGANGTTAGKTVGCWKMGDGLTVTGGDTLNTGTVTSVEAGAGLSGGTITSSGTISMPNVGTPGTYSGVTTDAHGRVTAGTARSFAYLTRALNTCFQVSATRDAAVAYHVTILATSSLSSGQAGTAYLRTYTNSGCSAGTQEVGRMSHLLTQALGLSVTINSEITGALVATIPAGAYAQIVTENNTGTPIFTARPSSEVLQ